MSYYQPERGSVQSYEEYLHLLEETPSMVRIARRAAEQLSVSYRGVKVGCAVLGIAEDGTTGIVSAGNVKPKKEKQKVCAEPIALNKAKKDKYARALGLVVVGPSDKEIIEGIMEVEGPGTLYCCVDCVNHAITDHPLMQPDTPIVTVGERTDRYQVTTPERLKELYLHPEQFVSEALIKGLKPNAWQERVDFYQQRTQEQYVLPQEERLTGSALYRMAVSMPVLAEA